MKGIVFSEFIELVESKFSIDIADQILQQTELESGGSYTSVGTYDHTEMVQLVVKLSELTGIPVTDLLCHFGEHLTGRFTELYPAFFNVEDIFSFLDTIENHVHVEVKKLYPDAELPHFKTTRPDANTLVMNYSSFRPFADLAEGLIRGAIAHFGEAIELQRQKEEGYDGTHETFILKRLSNKT